MFSSKKILFSSTTFNSDPASSPNGSLWAWGTGTFATDPDGRISTSLLGDGSKLTHTEPIQIGGKYSNRFGDHKWSSLSSDGRHILAIREDGTMWGWGLNEYGVLGNLTDTPQVNPIRAGGVGSKWKEVSTASYNTLAIRDDGTMWSWGSSEGYGLLGDGGIANARYNPYKIGNDTWISVSTNGQNCSAIRSDGTLWSWGRAGTVGDPISLVQRETPVQISTHTDWVEVSNQGARRSNGEWWIWGLRRQGCCDEDAWTKDCAPSDNSTSINPDPNADFACRCPGCVYGMVTDINGNLVDDGSLRKVVGTWSKIYDRVGIRSNNTIWGFGQGYCLAGKGWEIGFGESYPFPVSIYSSMVPPETTWSQISCVGPISNQNMGHGAGIRTDGSLWTWGDNSLGQCGTGFFNYSQDMMKVGNATWSKVFCFGKMTFAIR